MPEPKTVLMLHLDRQQAKIWDAALESQGIQSDWQPEDIEDIDVIEMLKEIYAANELVPDLLIMDIGIKSPNSNSLQVVPVCNWCRSLDIPLQVLLLNSSSMQVKAYEEKWATNRCGAIAIVPKLSQSTLKNTTELVTRILGVELNVEALGQVALLLADIYTEHLEAEIAKIKNAIDSNSIQNSEPLANKIASISSYRGSSLGSPEDILSETRIQPSTEMPDNPKPKVSTYRGVKVKKLQW